MRSSSPDRAGDSLRVAHRPPTEVSGGPGDRQFSAVGLPQAPSIADASMPTLVYSGSSPQELRSVLAAADPATRAQTVQRLQHERGNAFVQRLLTEVGREESDSDQTDTEPDILGDRIDRARAGGEVLDLEARRHLEAGLGKDLRNVRVHADQEADQLARAVQAVAFTTGRDMFFREGAYRPSSVQGLHLLAHEAAHVIQQGAGPVAGSPAGGGIQLSDPSDSYERTAESVANGLTANYPHKTRGPPVLQTIRKKDASPCLGSAGGALSVQRCGLIPCNCPTEKKALALQREVVCDDSGDCVKQDTSAESEEVPESQPEPTGVGEQFTSGSGDQAPQAEPEPTGVGEQFTSGSGDQAPQTEPEPTGGDDQSSSADGGEEAKTEPEALGVSDESTAEDEAPGVKPEALGVDEGSEGEEAPATEPEARGVGEEFTSASSGPAGAGIAEFGSSPNTPSEATQGSGCTYEPGEVDESRASGGAVDGFPPDPALSKDALLSDFEPGQTAIRPAHGSFLREIVGRFHLDTTQPTAKVSLLQGFTDCVAKENINLGLRKVRASLVFDFLLSQNARMENLGRAEAGPAGEVMGDNLTRKGRARNRSVLIRVEPQASTEPSPPPPPKKCRKGQVFQARIVEGASAGQFFEVAHLTMEIHNLDCKIGRMFSFDGVVGLGLGTFVSISGTSAFKRFSTDKPVGFHGFEGAAIWNSFQAQLGVGPSLDIFTGQNISVIFFGLKNFPDPDATETGKGVTAAAYHGPFEIAGDEFRIGTSR